MLGVWITNKYGNISLQINTSSQKGIYNNAAGKWVVFVDSSNNARFVGYADSSTKATQDSDGKQINTTYAKLTDVYFSAGNTYSVSSSIVTYAGYITNGSKTIRFTIPLPRRLNKVSSATVNTLNLTIRKGTAGYIKDGENDYLNDSNKASISCTFKGDNLLTIEIVGTAAWANAVNNTTISVAPINLKVTFT